MHACNWKRGGLEWNGIGVLLRFVRIPVAGRRGLVDGSGAGFLGRWIVDFLFVFDGGRDGLRAGGVCHVWFIFVMGWEMGDGRLEESDGYRERERSKENDGKITKCCSLTHIPSNSRSGSRW